MPGRKAESKTALFAAMAIQLRRVPSSARLGYLKGDLGVDLSPATVANAVRDSPRLGGSHLPIFQQADAEALEFFSACVRLRVDRRRAHALAAVRGIAGVTEVLRLQERGDLIAVVIYETPSAMRIVEGRLAEHGEIVEWTQVDTHDHAPALGTWEALAREAAAIEGLRA